MVTIDLVASLMMFAYTIERFLTPRCSCSLSEATKGPVPSSTLHPTETGIGHRHPSGATGAAQWPVSLGSGMPLQMAALSPSLRWTKEASGAARRRKPWGHREAGCWSASPK